MTLVPGGAILKLWVAKGQLKFFKNWKGNWELQPGGE